MLPVEPKAVHVQMFPSHLRVRIRNGPLLGIPCYVVKSPDLGSVMLPFWVGREINVQYASGKMWDPKTTRLWDRWRTFVFSSSILTALPVVRKSILPWLALLKQVKPHNQHQRPRYIEVRMYLGLWCGSMLMLYVMLAAVWCFGYIYTHTILVWDAQLIPETLMSWYYLLRTVCIC